MKQSERTDREESMTFGGTNRGSEGSKSDKGGLTELEQAEKERKQAEQALREKELMVQSLVAHAPFSVWMCDGEGTIIFANQAALDLFGVTEPAQVIGHYNIYRDTTEAEKPFLACFERAWAGEVVRYRQDLDMTTVKYDTSRQETLHFHTTLFAIPSVGEQRPHIVVIQEDVTEKVRAEAHIQHLHRVLEAIRNINQLIVSEKNQQKLLQGVCEILSQTRDYKLVWIGLVQEGTKDVLPAAQAGFEEGYLKSVKITWDDSEAGRGPIGTAIKTRKPFVMRDIAGDPRYKPWRGEAIKRGYASSAAVPLVHKYRVFGALNVYAALSDAFDEEEIGLLVEVGRDIAFALHSIELEEERKLAEEHILRQSAVLDAINKVFQETLRCETDEEVARMCLAVAEELTGSKFGFIGEMNESGRFDTIALSDPGWETCRMPKSDAVRMIKDMEIRGIYGRVLKDGRSLIVNDPASHPDRIGVPEGHSPLTSFLGVPLKREGKTVGMIALANKEDGYNLADQENIEILSVAFLEALIRKRAEGELRKHREHLEALVKERTAELEKKNKELERFNKLFVGRELRIAELKKEIERLKREIEEMKQESNER